MNTFTCPYGRPGVPHSPHEWGPALTPNYCPGEQTSPGDGDFWLALAGGLFLLALLLLCGVAS